jgi:hypothetical protein
MQDLEYSFTFTNLMLLNWQHGSNDNQLSIFQYVKYRSILNNDRNFTFSTTFVHNLGIQLFFDSIYRFQPDENTLDARLDFRIHKNLNISVLSSLSTRLFNAYDYSTDQTGNLLKTLNSSFLTPLLCTFSAGLGWAIPKLGKFSLGLSAGKFTLIRNRKIYEELGVSEFYGVSIERNSLFEYGLSLHLLFDKKFLNRIQWNCDVLIFKNYQKPIDLVMKNMVGLRINKYLKTSIQTRLFYEKEISKDVQIENLISIGFYFIM